MLLCITNLERSMVPQNLALIVSSQVEMLDSCSDFSDEKFIFFAGLDQNSEFIDFLGFLKFKFLTSHRYILTFSTLFLFPPPPPLQIFTCKCPIVMKIYKQTNKATSNIFDVHTQPRKTTRYTNLLKLV